MRPIGDREAALPVHCTAPNRPAGGPARPRQTGSAQTGRGIPQPAAPRGGGEGRSNRRVRATPPPRAALARRAVRALLLAGALIGAAPAIAAAQTEPERGIPYLTTRDKTGAAAPGAFYGEARGDPRAGWCGIDQLRLELLAPVAEAAPFHVPEEILRLGEIREMPRDALFDELRASTAGAPPLLYTHGFYVDFEKGCRRATIFKENAGLDGRFLWFSWPSDGALLNYSRDEADLYWSVPDLAEAIVEMTEAFAPRRIDIAAHSLGARGVVLALSDLASRRPDLRVGEIALLAPDMDFGIFVRTLPRIRPMARGITIYTADADRPLALSAQLHGYPRLGQSGNDVAQLGDVDVIDISELPVRSPTGHLYHIYNAEVGEDLRQLIVEGLSPPERRRLAPTGPNSWSLRPDE